MAARRSIAYVPQDDAFFNELTVLENIRLFSAIHNVQPSEGQSRGKVLLKRMQMEDTMNNLCYQLSGGQRKRLNIILSILHRPKVLMMDEPFAGLDFYNRKLLWDFIMELKSKEKVTVLLTTHLLNEAEKYCNRILIIKDGKKFSSGYIKTMLRTREISSVMELSFPYISNANMQRIMQFSKGHKIRVLDMKRNSGLFALPGIDARDKLIEMMKRSGIDYVIDEFRPPTLDDLFLLVAR
jgi:ABC-2 type transport system ATP-binding protein